MTSRERWYDEQRDAARQQRERLIGQGHHPTKVNAVAGAGLLFGWLAKGGWLVVLGGVLALLWLT